MGAGAAVAGEAGAEGRRQHFAEDGTKHGEAGGEDTDIAFDVEPDAGVDEGI